MSLSDEALELLLRVWPTKRSGWYYLWGVPPGLEDLRSAGLVEVVVGLKQTRYARLTAAGQAFLRLGGHR
jgi:hypothetical protein